MNHRHPNPNVCPVCLAPLTQLVQCIMQDCETNVLCTKCGTRLTPFQGCPNPACTAFDDTSPVSPIDSEQELFEDDTRVKAFCMSCGERKSDAVRACPNCHTSYTFETVLPVRSTIPPSSRSAYSSRRYSGVVPKGLDLRNPDEEELHRFLEDNSKKRNR